MPITALTVSGTTLLPATTARGPGFSGGTYDASTGVVTFSSNDGIGFSTGDLRGNLAAPGAIGGTTPAAGAFTTLDASGVTTLAGHLTQSGSTAKLGTGGENVMIGSIDAPTNPLHINGGTTNNVVRVQSSDAGAYLTFDDNSTTATGHVRLGAEGDDMVFTAGNTEVARMDDQGNFITGNDERLLAGFNIGPGIQSLGTGGAASMLVGRFSANTTPPRIILAKGRGSIATTSTIVQNGDELGEIAFAGADGTDLNSLAGCIKVVVDGTPGTGDMPGRMEFYTTADGSETPTRHLTLWSDGEISMHNLPTSNPGGSGKLWDNSGVVNIT